jgi:hypothetical protein
MGSVATTPHSDVAGPSARPPTAGRAVRAARHHAHQPSYPHVDRRQHPAPTASGSPSRAGWSIVRVRSAFGVEADLAEHALPLLDGSHRPRLQRYQHEHTTRWSGPGSATPSSVAWRWRRTGSIGPPRPRPLRRARCGERRLHDRLRASVRRRVPLRGPRRRAGPGGNVTNTIVTPETLYRMQRDTVRLRDLDDAQRLERAFGFGSGEDH